VIKRMLVVAATCLSSLSLPAGAAAPAGPHEVELTWMSIANWYFRLGDLRIIMDGYITRVPGPPFFFPPAGNPADPYAFTQGPYTVDVDSVSKVKNALPANGKLDYVLVGHSHFDHSWDSPTWSKLTGAPIIGGLSTCYQAIAQNLPADRCKVVDGGEKIDLGSGVTMRVVRFNHSGNASNPIQHLPVELGGPPTPAIGFGLGIERILIVCDAENTFPAPVSGWIANTNLLTPNARKPRDGPTRWC